MELVRALGKNINGACVIIGIKSAKANLTKQEEAYLGTSHANISVYKIK